MRKITAVIYVSLDGVMQSPGAPQEDPSGDFRLGGWMVPLWDEQLAKFIAEAHGENYDLLLGRRTYEMMAAFWPYADPAWGEFVDKLNSTNKYVVAGLDTSLDWSGSHRLDGEVTQAVAELKKTEGRPLLIQGSRQLIQSLLAAELIDEISIATFPIVLGPGKRLFENGAISRAWTLVSTRQSPKGVIVSTYERGGDVLTGTFTPDNPSDAEIARRERLAREG